MPQLAKLSSKGQVTVPAEVRKALHLKTGDSLAWDIQDNGYIFVHRVEPIDITYFNAMNGTLSEWDSSEDEEVFRDL